jgi:hypothetical protein
MRLVYASDAIDEAFNGTEDRIDKGTLAFEDAGHIDAEGFRAEKNESEEEKYLKPAIRGHRRSSLC